MAIMQPLIDKALQVSTQAGLKKRPEASGSAIGPSAGSRCEIVEGLLPISDSEQ
jgi:hypothetical protein